MEILNINNIVDAVLIVLLYLYWKFVPTNGAMFLEVQRLKKLCAQLSEIIEVDRTEMWEHIEGTLKPLTNRLTTRIKRAERAEDKDLKDVETLKKKGGIIKPADYKKYGLSG